MFNIVRVQIELVIISDLFACLWHYALLKDAADQIL